MAMCQKLVKGFYLQGAATRHRCPIPPLTPGLTLCSLHSGGAQKSYGVWPTPLKWQAATCYGWRFPTQANWICHEAF